MVTEANTNTISLRSSRIFKMVMERSHFEDSLAVTQLKVGHLNDVTQGLSNIDDPHENQDQGISNA